MFRTKLIPAYRPAAAAVFAAATALVVGATPSSATTTPPSGSSYAEQIANQEVLSDFRSWMMDRPDFNKGEYVSSTDDLVHRSIQLLWYGHSEFLTEVQAEAARRGISVSVDEALFSTPQYQAAADRILSDTSLQLGALSPKKVIGDDPNFKGLVVSVSTSPSAPTTSVTLSSEQLISLSAQITALTGYPAKTVQGDPAVPAAVTRDTDTPPVNSGGLMIHGSGICSSGLTITINNVTYTSTARHCTSVPYTARDGSTSYGGTHQVVSQTQWRVLEQRGYFWMFDGNYATTAKKTVRGWGDVGVNDYVFTSGGNSGTHPNLKVTTTTAYWNDGYGSAEQIEATNPTGGIAVMAGDSGGPVFTYHTDNVTVGASGMIQYFTGTASSCGTSRDPNPCGKTVGFTSVHATVDSILGARLYSG